MPLHPEVQQMIDGMSGSGLALGEGASPDEVRAVTRSLLAVPDRRTPIHAVADDTIPGPGGEIPIRVYRPRATVVLPAIVWFHGGGFVIGDLETHDEMLRNLAIDARCAVVSVDYRLAPEHKFPAAVDDAVAAWCHVAQHATDIGFDPTHLAIGGDSAGGCLAIVATLAARDAGAPRPCFQLLVYPVTDYEFESDSMHENATGYFLTVDGIRWYNDHYARSDADHVDWRYSPLRAGDVSELPPALVVTAEFDPLRDQGEAFVRRLRGAGIDATGVRADGLFHGFFGMHAFLEPARPVWDVAMRALRDALGTEAEPA
jgi:acetyl esterase